MGTNAAWELARKRRRRAKTKKLKARLAKAASEDERRKILNKLQKVNPFLKPGAIA